MRRIYHSMLAVLFALLATSAFAVIDSYTFDNEEQEVRFFQLTNELRCPKCQNQSIADSDAMIAQDLRREVHRMLLEGDSDQQVIDFMLDRYGDFVLYNPRLDKKTIILWFGPAILLLLGLFALLMIVRSNRRARQQAAEPLSTEEQNTLDRLLQKDSAKDKEGQS